MLIRESATGKVLGGGSTKVFNQIIVLQQRCVVGIFEIALDDNGGLNLLNVPSNISLERRFGS
jgi:hypothetical protein